MVDVGPVCSRASPLTAAGSVAETPGPMMGTGPCTLWKGALDNSPTAHGGRHMPLLPLYTPASGCDAGVPGRGMHPCGVLPPGTGAPSSRREGRHATLRLAASPGQGHARARREPTDPL